MIKRSLAVAAWISVLLLLLMTGLASASSAAGKLPPPPPFDPENFSRPTRITNPYFPLVPGTIFTYRTTTPDGTEENVVEVTRNTRVVAGVRCVVVHDVVTVDGELLEDTYDWYAQDDSGNVWYMGEDTREYENGEVVSTAGSWEAGVDGAQPGYIMEADPMVGDVYRQEYLRHEAEDMARVLSLTASVTTPYGSWQGNVLQTEETTPLERKVMEYKYYAPNVGFVRSETVSGGSEVTELLSVTR